MSITLIHPDRAALRRAATAIAPDREEYASVHAHLSSGCEACGDAFSAFLRAASMGGPIAEATSDWVRPERVQIKSGLRSGALADYQIVCGAGPYELDVLVRDTETTASLSFVGQVTWADRVHEPVKELPLKLLGAPALERPLRGRTNEYGEFQLSTQRHGSFGLQLGERSDAPCVMVWEGWDV